MSRQLATFRLDARTYGIDVVRVQEVLRNQPRTRVPLAPSTVAGLINLRGQVVTAVDLRERLELPRRAEGVQPMVVVVRVGDEPISLLVDSIGDVVDVQDDEFEPPPETLVGPARDVILGAYKLDGLLLLALDVDLAVAA